MKKCRKTSPQIQKVNFYQSIAIKQKLNKEIKTKKVALKMKIIEADVLITIDVGQRVQELVIPSSKSFMQRLNLEFGILHSTI